VPGLKSLVFVNPTGIRLLNRTRPPGLFPARRAARAGPIRGNGLVNRGGPLQGVAVRWWPSARTRNLYFGHLLSSFVTFSHLVTVAAVYDRRKWVETVKKRSSFGCSINDLCKMSKSLVKKIWRVAAELTRLKSFFGGDGALRRPLTGASGFFAGQLPAGHPEATVLNQSARHCRWHRLRWGERAGTDLNPEELLGARGYGECARIARSEGQAIPERLYPPKK